MHPILRPNQERARYAIIGLYIVAAGTIASVISAFMQYQLLGSANIGMAEAEANDQRERIIAIINVIIFIINAVLFISWFRRAYFNLHQVPGATPSFTEGWAAGAWFVPFLNLARPYQIGKEIYQQSKEQAGESDDNNSLPGLWWATFLIMNISANIAARLARSAESPEEFKTATLVNLVVEGLTFIAIFLAIRFIKTTSRYEDAMQHGLLVDEIGEPEKPEQQEQV